MAQMVEYVLAYYTLPGIRHVFGISWLFIPVCLIKQPYDLVSRVCVKAYMRVKWVDVSVHSKSWMLISLEYTFPNPRWLTRSFGLLPLVRGGCWHHRDKTSSRWKKWVGSLPNFTLLFSGMRWSFMRNFLRGKELNSSLYFTIILVQFKQQTVNNNTYDNMRW